MTSSDAPKVHGWQNRCAPPQNVHQQANHRIDSFSFLPLPIASPSPQLCRLRIHFHFSTNFFPSTRGETRTGKVRQKLVKNYFPVPSRQWQNCFMFHSFGCACAPVKIFQFGRIPWPMPSLSCCLQGSRDVPNCRTALPRGFPVLL